jgi:hypothetical protein
MNPILLLVLLVLLFGAGGGYYGGWYGPRYNYGNYGYGGLLPILLVILLVWFLIGNVHGFPIR